MAEIPRDALGEGMHGVGYSMGFTRKCCQRLKFIPKKCVSSGWCVLFSLFHDFNWGKSRRHLIEEPAESTRFHLMRHSFFSLFGIGAILVLSHMVSSFLIGKGLGRKHRDILAWFLDSRFVLLSLNAIAICDACECTSRTRPDPSPFPSFPHFTEKDQTCGKQMTQRW